MKKLVVGSLAFVFALVLSTSVFARTLEITEYCGEKGLIARGNNPVQVGDVLNVKKDIIQLPNEQDYVQSNWILGSNVPESGNITINGNGHTFDGNGYDGFKMTAYVTGTDNSSTINNATLTNYDGYVIEMYGDYNSLVELTLNDVDIVDNNAGIWVYSDAQLNVVSNGTVNISSNTCFNIDGYADFRGKNIILSSTTLTVYNYMYNNSNLTTDGISGYGYIYNDKTINLGADNESFVGTITVDNGTINLLEGATYFNEAEWHSYKGNSTLNLINDTIDEVKMAKLELTKATMKVNVDVNLEEGSGDKLDIEQLYNNDYIIIRDQRVAAKAQIINDFPPISKIVIDKINILADSPDEEEVSVEIANSTYQDYIHLARNKAYSTYYGYNVKISSTGSTSTQYDRVVVAEDSTKEVDYGNTLIFSRIDDKARNPELLQSKVAIAGSNISQDEIFTTVFNNAGNYTFFQKQGSNAGDVEDRDAPTLWVKAFGSKEDVELKEYTTVETTYYGAVVGLDWDRQYTDNFDATYGVFASYIGGKLKDDDWDNEVDQSGGYIGVRGNWYFGKLFVNGIIDYALIQNSADTTEDSNDFNSQVAGLAARVGYNFEVARRSFTIQPNLGVTGKYIITDDYDTIVDGDKRKLSIDNITNITIEPGLKLAKNLGKCWILTGEGKYVIENVSGDVTADDIVLPDTSYDNYANVGLGVEKIWGYTVLQLKANKTFGGRDGFIINAGIEYKF